MLSIENRSQIWQTMIEPTRFGIPRWKEGFEPSPTDPRTNPVNYMLMCEDFKIPSRQELDVSHLKQLTTSEFLSEIPENTGVLGLLRTVSFMGIEIDKPENVLLVGSMNHSGVAELSLWLEVNEWRDTRITVVDKESVPLHTIDQLMQHGEIKWRGGIKLVKSDIRNFTPDGKFDLVIGDILNPYIDSFIGYPRFYRESPYQQYEEYLRQVKLLTKKWFLSRCLGVKEQRKHFVRNTKSANLPDPNRLETIWGNFGAIASQLNKEATLETEGLFTGYSPCSFCGLWMVSSDYRAKNILSGKNAERVYRRLYQRHFPGIHHSVTIRDSLERTFINYACDLRQDSD